MARGEQVDVVLLELARVAALPGGSPLGGPFFDAHRAEGVPGASRLIQRFGSWRQACEAAGVAPIEASRSNYGTRWTDDLLLGWVREYLADPDSTASYQQFQGWLKERKSAGAPSGQTVRNRLGTWKDILERARA